jgi:hypothetical protein
MAKKRAKRKRPSVRTKTPSAEPSVPLSDARVAGMVVQERHVNRGRVLNCVPSVGRDQDWTIEAAQQAGIASAALAFPPKRDLRTNAQWWRIRDQENTGACVGFACADSVLRWHYVKAGWLKPPAMTSPRFVWMANKETDDITSYPTTFIEAAGTQTKHALRIARRYGCVTEKLLPMSGGLYTGSAVDFYAEAAQLRIRAFFNLGCNLNVWRYWIAYQGPILTRLNCDGSWMRASSSNYELHKYPSGQRYGGHAVALVGYTKDYFIVRNSWGTGWGRRGYVHAYDSYASKAFTEAYGAVL